MASPVQKIIIVGGGSAGWITAGLLAAKRDAQGAPVAKVSVLESPDIPIVGVGEGTWPSMRNTLRKMGVHEHDFITACSASFKQGSKFCQWRKKDKNDFYYHPFDVPEGFEEGPVAEHWLTGGRKLSFSKTVCAQESLCEIHLSPKQPTSPNFGGFSNYGYHLDAGAFSVFLRDHCVKKLDVTHIADTMIEIEASENGDITAVKTKHSGMIAGDLFVDCTGFRSLLLGGHFGVELTSKADILFPDTALAVQAPYREGDPVQSTTVATAQDAGWIWDVSLSSRRGVGHVYSSSHMDEEQATECVRSYLGLDEKAFSRLGVRKLGIGSGCRKTFWQNNCVAIGLSAGFLEPLEASALMLCETSANMIADALPMTREKMPEEAARFNARIHHIWDRIIHFLKLHYCLSKRDEPFWRDNRSTDSMPQSLQDDLVMWREKVPWLDQNAVRNEVFPPASYQYVLYGMGYETSFTDVRLTSEDREFCEKKLESVIRNSGRLKGLLSANRDILDYINNAGP